MDNNTEEIEDRLPEGLPLTRELTYPERLALNVLWKNLSTAWETWTSGVHEACTSLEKILPDQPHREIMLHFSGSLYRYTPHETRTL